jgi:mannosyltransferase
MDRSWLRAVLGALGGAVVVAAVVLRFVTRSDLWLDEALSANIAALPLARIPDALRHDGFPPLFYWLLHLWTAVLGDGDTAVRALSGVAAVAAVPVAWFAGRRLGGPRAAWATTLVLATSPFAIRYATEARMYALLSLLSLLGYLAVARALERPSAGRLVAVAAAAAALVLLHYWALYLVVVVLAALALRAVRARDPAALRVLLAGGAGALALVPWLGVLRYQLEHTGTPWTAGTQPFTALTSSVAAWGGGPGIVAKVLGTVLVALAVWAVVACPPARTVAAIAVATFVLAVAVGTVSESAFQPRYTAVIAPLVVLLAGVGLARLPDVRLAAGALVVVLVLGLVGGVREARLQRTQGGEVASVIAAEAAPGDVVVYCPDQLGPATARHLPHDVPQEPFPLGGDPRFVDWVDYEDRNEDADPAAFAEDLLRKADRTGSRIWYAWAYGYRTYGTTCEAIVDLLRATGRPATTVVARRTDVDEDMELIRYDRSPDTI